MEQSNIEYGIDGNKIILFGAGQEGKELTYRINKNKIKYFVDNNVERVGKYLEEIEIVSVETMLSEYTGEIIVITTLKYEQEIRKQLSGLKLYNMFNGEQYIVRERLKNYSDVDKKILLMNVNDNINIGDQAIVWAEYYFLKKYFPQYSVVEFTINECANALDEIYMQTNENDLVIITGGGFLGSLWKIGGEYNVRTIISKFQNNRIIIFPQSMYFFQNEQGRLDMEETCNCYNSHNNLTVIFREVTSYMLGKKIFEDRITILYMPDIVTILNLSEENIYERKGVTFCIREDCEGVLDRDFVDSLEDELKNKGIAMNHMSMLASRNVYSCFRMEEIKAKLEMIQKSSLVITDRLHCMLLCLISGTQCLAIDNLTHKVSGVYEWIKDNQYIHLVQVEDLNFKFVGSLLDNNGFTYDNKKVMRKFDELSKYIADVWEKDAGK
jgi:pyruvyl transferase EpsI